MNISKPAYKIGELVEGEGIFIGEWRPADKNGKPLGKSFNLFAAPQDLKHEHENADSDNILYDFDHSVEIVAGLKNYHGHNGATNIKGLKDILLAVESDNSKALKNWFLPTQKIMEKFLYKNRNTRELKGTFNTHYRGSAQAYWAWPETVWAAGSIVGRMTFSDGAFSFVRKSFYKSSIRPVRAVENPPKPIALQNPLKLRTPVRF